jgi:hypothetical protein
VLDRLGVGIVDLFGVMWLRRRFAVPELIEPEPIEMEAAPAEAPSGEMPVRNVAPKLHAARTEPAL